MSAHVVFRSLVLGVLLAGCASIHPVQQSSGAYTALNERLEGRRATIVLLDNQTRQGRLVSVDADSVRWTRRRRGRVQAVATADVHALQVVRGRGRGAVRGLTAGVVVGGGIFAVFTKKAESASTLPQGFGYVYGGLVLGGLSALVSTIVGAGIGTTERYVLNDK